MINAKLWAIQALLLLLISQLANFLNQRWLLHNNDLIIFFRGTVQLLEWGKGQRKGKKYIVVHKKHTSVIDIWISVLTITSQKTEKYSTAMCYITTNYYISAERALMLTHIVMSRLQLAKNKYIYNILPFLEELILSRGDSSMLVVKRWFRKVYSALSHLP